MKYEIIIVTLSFYNCNMNTINEIVFKYYHDFMFIISIYYHLFNIHNNHLNHIILL